jgi:4-amino-4-deoxy-L-arabinose transferase-like glycosyltransferase
MHVPVGRARHGVLAVLIAGSVLFQLALLLPNADMTLHNDEVQYVFFSEEILGGRGLTSSLRPPVYPFLIALGRGAVGLEPPRLSVGLLQIGISALSMTLLYLLASDLFDRRAGLVAAGMFGFYPTIAAHTHLLWSESFMLCLIIASLLTVERAQRSGRPLVALAAGGVLGLAALTRQYMFWFIPIASLWLAFSLAPARLAARQRTLAAALVLAGALVVVLPWTARNYRVHGEFLLIASNSWTPLFLENNTHPEWSGPNSLLKFYKKYRGREFERERFAREYTLNFIRARMPTWVVDRIRVGLPALLSLEDFPLRHLRSGWYGEVSKGMRVAAVAAVTTSYVALLIAFSFGLVATRLNSARVLVLLFMFFAAALVLPFPVVTRYRLPLEALAIPFAAAWITRSEATAGRLRSRVRLAVGMLIAASLVGISFAGGWWAIESILGL